MRKSPKIGLIIAPLVGAFVYMLLGFIFGEDNTPKNDYTGLQAWPFYVMMYTAVAILCYLVSIFIGMPLLSYLKRRGKLEFWKIILISIPIGALSITTPIYLLVRDETIIFIPLLFFAAYGAVTGVAVSLTYCWLAGITRHSS